MKRRLSYIMMVVLSATVLASCNQEVIQDNSYGYLGVSLANDLSEDVMTKADEEELVFAIDVQNASGESVGGREDHRTITSENPIKLYVGTYSVVARSGELQNAAFDTPYYEGKSETFKITPSKTTTANVTCTLANTIFSVEFPGDFSTFSDYEVAVTNGVGDKLVLSNAPQEGNELERGFDSKAYFAVTGTLTWELYLKNTDGGEYRATNTYTDVKARQHYHLKFTMGEDETAEGGFVIKIGVDNSWDDSEHSVILDFSKKNMPAVASNEGLSAVSGEPVSVPVGNATEKTLDFTASEGIRSLRVMHENSLLAEKGVPSAFELVGASSELLSSLGAAGIMIEDVTVKSVDAGAENVSMNITDLVASLPVGTYGIDFTLIDMKGRYEVFELKLEIISDVDAEAVAARTGWASFAQLEGRFFDSSLENVVTFQYRKASASDWIEISPSEINVNAASMRYSVMLFGLEPSTEYVFRAVSPEDKDTKVISFTTAAAETLHNLSFDNWYKNGDAWMPNSDSGNYVWDSANPGTASLGTVPTTPEDSDVVKGRAARLETTTAMGMLAAGNIYVGQFAKVSGLGAELDWGYGFTSRPLALRGYYKYAPKNIDMVKDPYKDLKGQGDQCQIQILLTDWPDRFHINTSKKIFVDFENDEYIIAHGSFVSGNTDSGYVKFTLPLVYRNYRTPKYIVVVAAASRYGDYFTGGKGSVLKVDEFELVYDPSELTDEEFNEVFSKISPF